MPDVERITGATIVHGSGTTRETLARDSAAAKGTTIALSAIIAATWAGVWGFNWAATHLSSDQLFPAILIGLGVGTGLTAYVIERTFWFVEGRTGTVIIKAQ